MKTCAPADTILARYPAALFSAAEQASPTSMASPELVQSRPQKLPVCRYVTRHVLLASFPPGVDVPNQTTGRRIPPQTDFLSRHVSSQNCSESSRCALCTSGGARHRQGLPKYQLRGNSWLNSPKSSLRA